MRKLFVLVLVIAMPGVILADAADGQFMGFQLGNNYQRGANTQTIVTTNGNLKITAENPVKPANVGEVTLITTPETLTIGYINALTWFDTEAEAREFGRAYIRLLRAKYPDWAFGREVMDANMNVVEVNLDKHPHNLQMQLTEGRRDGKAMWRISMTLQWLPGTKEEKAWSNMSHTQQITAQQKDRELLLDQADTRGL
ncbi:MAG: hypothetical protein WBM71_16500 [Sedimenticolaceae bacterium]|jgi:hypothetical protein